MAKKRSARQQPLIGARRLSTAPSAKEEKIIIGVCRVCGCTDNDCTQCVEKTGEACVWVEPDLCSACAE
jgi:hypothetical protein